MNEIDNTWDDIDETDTFIEDDDEPEHMDYSYKGMSEAFLIFSKYNSADTYGNVSAGHDVIYAGASPKDVNEADFKRLAELGWRANYEYECFQYIT